MPYFNIVAQTNENTVVTEYEPVRQRSDAYQSEAALEAEFIRMLCDQGYTYLPIHTEAELIANLRAQMEALNNYRFSDDEWKRFFAQCVANHNDHIVEKTAKIQEDFIQVLKRDDGMTKNILLIDRKNIHNNRLQVINQYVIGEEQGARHDNRYDVTILVNGLWYTLSSSDVACPYGKPSTRSIGTSAIPSGRAAGCLSMCRSL